MSEEQTIWQGERKTMTSSATGGKVVSARYRITNQKIYFDAGLVSSKSEQVPLWAVRDIDVKQSMTQKARHVGDVIVKVQHSEYTGRPEVKLESIEKPQEVRDLLNQWSEWARHEHLKRQSTVHYQGQAPGQLPPPPGQSAAPASPAPAPEAAPGGDKVDLIAKLRELGELRDAGVLDDAEFAAAKAKLINS